MRSMYLTKIKSTCTCRRIDFWYAMTLEVRKGNGGVGGKKENKIVKRLDICEQHVIHEKLAKSNGPEISLWHFHGSCLKRARSLSRVTKTLASPDIKRLLLSWLATRIYKKRWREKKRNERTTENKEENTGRP